jgi:hypothetical protein
MIAPTRNGEKTKIYKLAQIHADSCHATAVASSDTSSTKLFTRIPSTCHNEKGAAGNITEPKDGVEVAGRPTGRIPWVTAGTRYRILTTMISYRSNSSTVLKHLSLGLNCVNETERVELRLAEEGRVFVLHYEEPAPSSPSKWSPLYHAITPLAFAFDLATLTVRHAFGVCMVYTGGTFFLFFTVLVLCFVGSVVMSVGNV